MSPAPDAAPADASRPPGTVDGVDLGALRGLLDWSLGRVGRQPKRASVTSLSSSSSSSPPDGPPGTHRCRDPARRSLPRPPASPPGNRSTASAERHPARSLRPLPRPPSRRTRNGRRSFAPRSRPPPAAASPPLPVPARRPRKAPPSTTTTATLRCPGVTPSLAPPAPRVSRRLLRIRTPPWNRTPAWLPPQSAAVGGRNRRPERRRSSCWTAPRPPRIRFRRTPWGPNPRASRATLLLGRRRTAHRANAAPLGSGPLGALRRRGWP